jgi:Tol biopolymer transport system component
MKSMRLIINYFRLASRIVLVLLILSPAPARGLEDKIVFVFKHNGTPEVFLVEGLDGRPIQLTQDMFARWPSISPDGTEVVFVSNPPHGISNIFKLHIAKGKIEILTRNGKFNTEYSNLDWSPDARKILFTKIVGEKTNLCVMDMNTRDIQHILQTAPETYIGNPSWSPDSQHILYALDHVLPGQLGLRELFITDDNGIQVKKVDQDLTPLESLQRLIVPTWSPRRSEIAYFGLVDETNQPPPNPYHIYSMNLGDGMVTALTSGGAENRIPKAWRPDGQKILLTISSPYDEEVRTSDFYVMDPDGENMINLNLAQSSEAGVTWSPDGKQIAFSRWLNEGELSIFVMDADVKISSV